MGSLSARLRSLVGSRSPWQLLAAAVAVTALALIGWWLLHAPAPPVESTLPRAAAPSTTTHVAAGSSGSPSSAPPTGQVVVQVVGAVRSPGVYELSSQARVTDAIAAAGGAVFGGDPSALRLAERVTDGQRIMVPRVGEPVVEDPPPASGSGSAAAPQEPVDINDATAEELDTLPGVGPATAAAIVAYRQEHGRFASVDELAEVRGIGPAKLDGLKGMVRV